MRINASKRNIEQYLNCNVGIKGLLKNKKGIHNIFICIPFLIKKKQPT